MKPNVLVSGASFAGLCTAYWMNRLGYTVTVIEIAPGLKKGGTPVNILDGTIDVVRRMGSLDAVKANALAMQGMAFKDAKDVTVRSTTRDDDPDAAAEAAAEYEIERDLLLNLLFEAVGGEVEFQFGDSVTALDDDGTGVDVAFRSGVRRRFDLVIGCDGIHSAVRKAVFGPEGEFARFLGAYFSITIVQGLLIPENTTQLFNAPDRAVMLNAYNGKTDIVLCFRSDTELAYDYRDETQQRGLIMDRFEGAGWRTPELLVAVKGSKTFYFDKFCQMEMPSWTKGRVALVGDAAYCASPAAGRGGSLAIDGAAALGDAFQAHPGDFGRAFLDYNTRFRPFIEGVQAQVVEEGLDMLLPRTQAAIDQRNAGGGAW